MMNKWLYIGIIFLLGVLNLRLLFHVQRPPIQVIEEAGIVEQEFNSDINLDALGIEKPIKGVRLIAFISDAGCVETIQQEVNLLNQIASLYPSFVRVYFDSSSDSYLTRLYNATFEHARYRSDHTIQYHSSNDPVAFLVDSKGTVQRIHISDRNDPKVSESFYAQMESLFSSL